MKIKLTILFTLFVLLFWRCKPENKQIDILDINLTNDWTEISKLTNLEQGLNNTSEYLNSYYAQNINNFKISDYELLIEKSVNDSSPKIPAENQVTFIFRDSNKEELIEVETEIGFLENDSIVLNLITKKYGQGLLLSEKGSINELKGIQNYIWKNLKTNQSLIVSTFSEGNIYSVEKKISIKQFKSRIYLVNNNAEISYPNGQKENIVERLVNQKSQ